MGQKDESAKELEIATKLEHEEVERHQHALKVLDLEDPGSTSADSVK